MVSCCFCGLEILGKFFVSSVEGLLGAAVGVVRSSERMCLWFFLGGGLLCVCLAGLKLLFVVEKL